jgi:hypothetical protein
MSRWRGRLRQRRRETPREGRNKRAHHHDARALFIQWHDQDDPRLISVVNLAELNPAGHAAHTN